MKNIILLVCLIIVILFGLMYNKTENFNVDYKPYPDFNYPPFYQYTTSAYFPPSNCMDTLFGGIKCFPWSGTSWNGWLPYYFQ